MLVNNLQLFRLDLLFILHVFSYLHLSCLVATSKRDELTHAGPWYLCKIFSSLCNMQVLNKNKPRFLQLCSQLFHHLLQPLTAAKQILQHYNVTQLYISVIGFHSPLRITVSHSPRNSESSSAICSFYAEMSRSAEFSFFRGNCSISRKILQSIYLAVPSTRLKVTK